MIITESKFLSNTKSKSSISFILENWSIKSFKNNEKGIFISHKHGEQEYVYRLKDLLEKYGFTGYVDFAFVGVLCIGFVLMLTSNCIIKPRYCRCSLRTLSYLNTNNGT